MKVGDKVRVKKSCDLKYMRGRWGIITYIDTDVDYPIEVSFNNEEDTTNFKLKELSTKTIKIHACGLICKKCNPRDMVEF